MHGNDFALDDVSFPIKLTYLCMYLPYLPSYVCMYSVVYYIFLATNVLFAFLFFLWLLLDLSLAEIETLHWAEMSQMCCSKKK